jgi:hypothetical protein
LKLATFMTLEGVVIVRARMVLDFEHDASVELAKRRNRTAKGRTDLLMARHHNDRHINWKEFRF